MVFSLAELARLRGRRAFARQPDEHVVAPRIPQKNRPGITTARKCAHSLSRRKTNRPLVAAETRIAGTTPSN
jgi:hypothetical protein